MHLGKKKKPHIFFDNSTATMSLLKCFPLNKSAIILYAAFLFILMRKNYNNARSYLVI